MSDPFLTVTVLAENTVQGLGLIGEHGLSLWVECAGTCVLFDTGQGLVLPHNVGRMNVDLGRADSIVLSHGHYDHTGGLSWALGRASRARLFLHPSALATRFACRDGASREVGMPGDARAAVHERLASVHWTREPAEIAPGIFVTGPIPRRTPFEDTGGPFFLDPQGTVPDPIEDDQALWIETADGLVLLLGCAHAGVVNTLDYIGELTRRKPVRAIVGGMHLGAASDERMARTIESLRRQDPAGLWPCHCTGPVATCRWMTTFGHRCQPCGVSTVIAWP